MGNPAEVQSETEQKYEALPLGRERRKGPVSAENPVSPERAKELVSQAPTMRDFDPSGETDVHDLMLAARERVQEETHSAYASDGDYNPGE